MKKQLFITLALIAVTGTALYHGVVKTETTEISPPVTGAIISGEDYTGGIVGTVEEFADENANNTPVYYSEPKYQTGIETAPETEECDGRTLFKCDNCGLWHDVEEMYLPCEEREIFWYCADCDTYHKISEHCPYQYWGTIGGCHDNDID